MGRLGVVFQIGSLGDSIVSLPALRSLRELLPDCDEYILVDRFDDVTKVLPLEVFEMVIKPRKRLSYRGPVSGSRLSRMGSIASLSLRLRYYRPHYAISLMPSERTAAQIARDRAFCRLIGAKELVGFEQTVKTDCREDACSGKQSSEAYLRLRRLWNGRSEEQFGIHGRTPLLKPTEEAHAKVNRWLHENRRFPDRPLVAVSPFSNWLSKDLSPATAIGLIGKLENEGAAEVIVAGGAKDLVPASSIIQRSGAGLNGCGIFSVGETAALLQQCTLAIAVDSGPMHLAAAVATPTVVIYSRTNAHLDRWFPLGTGHTILYRDVACAGCGESVCPVSDHPCVDGISVDEIFRTALNKLRGDQMPEIRSGTKMLTL